MEAEDRVISALKELGFTGTDARTYLALLKHHPATGYEVASRSGVPRSAVYGVLRRLESMGVINALEGRPARYIPLDPDRLVESMEARFSRHLETFKNNLEQVVGASPERTTWTLTGYRALLDEARRMIDGAEHRVVASLWRREALSLASAFEAARERGVEVVLFSFTALPSDVGEVLTYGFDEAELSKHWPRKILLVADDKSLLVGAADDVGENRSVYTDEPALVEMAISNLVLDVTLFGERSGNDTSAVVPRLTPLLAPVDELLGRVHRTIPVDEQ